MSAPRKPAFVSAICLIVAALSFAAMSPVLSCDFTTYDDADYVTSNPQVRTGLSVKNVLWAWTSFEYANWHPLTWLSLQLDAQLFGLDAVAFHRTNLVLHCLTAALLFLALLKLTDALWPAFIASVLFGVHPLHVESVAWIAERKDVLSALFWMLAFHSYAASFTSGRRWSRLCVGGWFALSLMAKPMAVTFPCVLLLIDWWPLRRLEQNPITSAKGCALEKLPLLALSLASCAVTLMAQQEGGAVQSTSRLPLLQRLLGAISAYGVYLWQMVCPEPLVVLWPRQPLTWTDRSVVLSGVVLVAATFLAIAGRKTRPYWLVGWLWYLGMLFPVIGIVAVGEQAHADRYTYLPLIGIFIIVAWESRRLVNAIPAGRAVGVTIGLALLAGCVVRSRQQCSVWRNGETLWRHALEHTPATVTSLFGLGSYYRNVEDAEAAAGLFRQVLEREPDYRLARSNLGLCLTLSGRYREAAEAFMPLMHYLPDTPEQAFRFAEQSAARKQPGLALVYLSYMLSQRPADAAGHYQLGIQCLNQGYPLAAERELLIAANLDPRLEQMTEHQQALERSRELSERRVAR